MAAVLSFKQTEPESAETLTDEIRDPAVLGAARHLIARHRAGQVFDINAFDVPHRALADIAEQLEAAGISHALSAPLIEALRRYVLASGGSFTRAVNAKPVVIRMAVANQMPDRRFENGMTELACIGTSETRVEGAASINVRATPSGTATTSNAANVDAMFANVRGLNLWVRFEAPTRDEMDALLTSMEASLAGVVQSVGGAMNADDLKKLLAKLEQDGVMTPAVLELVHKILTLQEGLSSGRLSGETLQALLGDITAIIKTAHTENMMPPTLIQAALTSLKEFSSNDAIVALLNDNGIAMKGIVADNDNLSTDLEMGKEILSLLEGLAVQIEAGDITADNLPPELVALIEKMGGIETLLQAEGRDARIQLLSHALTDDGPSPLPEAVHAALIAMANLGKDVLPADTAQLITNFIKDNPEIVEAATTHSLVRTMTERLGTMDGTSPEAAALAKAIELLKQDGFLALMDKNVQAALPAEAKQILQDFAQTNPGAVGILVTHSIMMDMKATMSNMDPSSPGAIELAKAMEILKSEGFSALIDEKFQAALPPKASEMIQTFAKDHPAIVEVLTSHAIMTDIKTMAAALDPSSIKAAELAQAIELLKENGFAALLDKETQANLPPDAVKIIQKFAENHPAAIEIAATNLLLSGMQKALIESNPASPQVTEITVLMQKIQAQGVTEFMKGNPKLSPEAALIVGSLLRKNNAHDAQSATVIPMDAKHGIADSGQKPAQNPPLPVPARGDRMPADSPKDVPSGHGADKKTNPDQAGNSTPSPKPDERPEPGQNKKTDTLKSPGQCGNDCSCARKFNAAARYEDKGNVIIYVNEKGVAETLTREEAFQKINADVTGGFGVNKDQWQEVLDKYQGNIVKAHEYVKSQDQLEKAEIEKAESTKGKYDTDNHDDDAKIRERIEQMKKLNAIPTPTGDSPTGIKEIFDECGPGCNHPGGHKNGKAPDKENASTGYKAKSIENSETPPRRTGYKGSFKERSAPKPAKM